MLIHFSSVCTGCAASSRGIQIVAILLTHEPTMDFAPYLEPQPATPYFMSLDDMVMDCELISDVHICPITSITPTHNSPALPSMENISPNNLFNCRHLMRLSTPLWTFCLHHGHPHCSSQWSHHSGCSSGRWMAWSWTGDWGPHNHGWRWWHSKKFPGA